jgi:hypothetical protein
VTVDRQTLTELREMLGPNGNLSALVENSLELALKKLKFKKLLEEWTKDSPPTEADYERAEEKWRAATE